MHIKEIIRRLNNYGPYEWIHPKNIEGLEIDNIIKRNKTIWFSTLNVEDISDNDDEDDEAITDYLIDCYSEQLRQTKASKNAWLIDGIMVVDAAAFMISKLASSYAATHFPIFSDPINKKNAQICLDLLESNYSKTTEFFIKDILRDFILDLYKTGPLWDLKMSKKSYVDKNSQEFLINIFKKGYYTINNKDARYFANGNKRFLS